MTGAVYGVYPQEGDVYGLGGTVEARLGFDIEASGNSRRPLIIGSRRIGISLLQHASASDPRADYLDPHLPVAAQRLGEDPVRLEHAMGTPRRVGEDSKKRMAQPIAGPTTAWGLHFKRIASRSPV